MYEQHNVRTNLLQEAWQETALSVSSLRLLHTHSIVSSSHIKLRDFSICYSGLILGFKTVINENTD